MLFIWRRSTQIIFSNQQYVKEKKKLLLDCCIKNAIDFDKCYEKKDSVSMGSSLGTVLANIIMTDLKCKIMDPLIANRTFKLYSRYINTLVLIKHEDIPFFLEKLNYYQMNLKFRWILWILWICEFSWFKNNGQ